MSVPAGRPVERRPGRVVELPEQRADVERLGDQARRDLALPDLARAVVVDLDAVPVGVGEVDRLADEVVRHPDERDALARGVGEPAREVRALGHAQGEVEEAGVAPGRRGARLLDEAEELGAPGAERGAAALAADEPEADLPAVVAERAVEVADREVDGAHARGRGDGTRWRSPSALTIAGRFLTKRS